MSSIPETDEEADWIMDTTPIIEDPLCLAKGIFHGLLYSTIVWGILAGVWWIL